MSPYTITTAGDWQAYATSWNMPVQNSYTVNYSTSEPMNGGVTTSPYYGIQWRPMGSTYEVATEQIFDRAWIDEAMQMPPGLLDALVPKDVLPEWDE